ncbi:hypothetical protein FRC02_005433 [Tulasnella sp. 418]|nr:hypothetical protein FRC02_005433 [Tulasnella sp. 418]
MAGHDLNYLAQSGVLSLMPPSRSGPSGTSPSFPLNILADFAGGGLTTALGILLALLERHRSGLGQIVENNMVDGARYVSSFPIIHSSDNPESPWFGRPVGDNLLDGGAPFYNVYLCKDNRYMSVACLEPQFYKTFLDTLLKTLSRSSPQFVREWENKGLIPRADNQMDRSGWGSTREFLEAAFLQLDRDSWANAFHDTDACAVPVLSLTEARSSAGVHANAQPSAHPLLSRTPAVDYGNIVGSNSEPVAACDVSSELCPGKHTISILRSFAGMSDSEIEYLIKKGAISHIDAFGTGESKL